MKRILLWQGSISGDMIVLQWFVPEGFLSLFALVGTNGQGIGTR